MGKKGSWISAIKRVFTSHSKEKQLSKNQEQDRKKKKKGLRKNGETNSFLPIFRQPSSIEKILSEAEQEHNLVFKPPPTSMAKASSTSSLVKPNSPKVSSSQRYVSSPRTAGLSSKPPSPRVVSPKITQRREFVHKPESTLPVKKASATKIQAAFRGYLARRSFRGLKGLVRLQGVIRGDSVKRQTINTMKYMQLLVRVQTQIQSNRIQMLEKRAKNENYYTKLASNSTCGDWDDSLLTKEEKEVRIHRKIDAKIKRERSMAYAYSHQLWKNSPKYNYIRPNEFPLWWNWLDHKNIQTQPFWLTPTPIRPNPSPQTQFTNQNQFKLNKSFDLSTPKSPFFKPIKTPQQRRGKVTEDSQFKDDNSLLSCPPFSAPSYMASTVSAKAKLKVDDSPVTIKRRISFPLRSLFLSSNKVQSSSSSGVLVLEKKKTLKSVGNLSVDSTSSMPSTVGRRAFNRFV